MDALVDISFDLGKINIPEPRGGGINGRIFIDGVEVLWQYIANRDATGVHGLLTSHLAIGSKVDFAIDPTGMPPGVESPYSARDDGTRFRQSSWTTRFLSHRRRCCVRSPGWPCSSRAGGASRDQPTSASKKSCRTC